MLCQNIFDCVPRALLETIRPSSLQNLLFKTKIVIPANKEINKTKRKIFKIKNNKKNSENNSTY